MDCERYRESISARLDGEDRELPDGLLDRHSEGCAECREYEQQAVELNRLVRMSEAPPIRDRTDPIMHTLDSGVEWSRRRWRGVLAALAVAKLATAVAGLWSGLDGGATLHAAREVAAWDLALAVALLLAAWQPVRAVGLVPLVAVGVGVMLTVSVVDVLGGRASPVAEMPHLIEAVGLAALWRLAGPVPVPAQPLTA